MHIGDLHAKKQTIKSWSHGSVVSEDVFLDMHLIIREEKRKSSGREAEVGRTVSTDHMDAIHCTRSFLKQSISLNDFGLTGLGHTHIPCLSFTV